MKLIVGLGNPGKKYEYTRHNMGFMAIDFYAKKNNLIFKSKFNGLYSEQTINNEKVIFLKPQTFMNLSGECVLAFVNYFHIDINDILIIYDDRDFEVGEFKIKIGGSSAGHNGIQNIIDNLKTSQIKRLRLGISKNTIPLIDYVLQRFTDEDLNKINVMLNNVNNIIDDFVTKDFEVVMSKYNGIKNEK